MSKNIYIDGSGGNIIVCLEEDKQLLEFHIEKRYTNVIVGSIFRGSVENILNGMQAAFVNIGLEKNGYLYIGDMLVDKNDINGDALPKTLELKVGDEIMVQVVKDASGAKGCRLSTHVSFAGRNLVYMPTLDVAGVSRKLTDPILRERLSSIIERVDCPSGGFVIRTAAETATDEEILSEAQYLINLYDSILQSFKKAKAGEVVHEEGNLALRALRDIYTEDVENIIISDRLLFDEVKIYAQKRGGMLINKLVLHNKPTDIFKEYELDDEIDKMLRKKVYLSSGAYINIDKTEALTAIDVNTGKFVGSESLEQTVYETNLLAATEIARQIRLRNISGIIIIDFIDMEEEAHRNDVLKQLEKAFRKDRTKCNIVGMTELGLVEVTRKKQRKESTARLTKKCPYCRGEGIIFSNDYIVTKIRVALLDIFAQGYKSAIIDVNAEIADYVLKYGALSKDVSKIWRDKRIYLVPHKTYHQEFFLVKGDNSLVLDLSDKARQLF